MLLVRCCLQKEDIKRLEERTATREGVFAEILSVRRDRLWSSMFQGTVELAKQVVIQRSDGHDVSAYWDQLEAELTLLPVEMRTAVERFQGRAVFPTDDLSPSDYVVADQKLFKSVRELQGIYKGLIDYIDIADEFGMDASNESDYMVERLTDHAANLSVFLELGQTDVGMLRSTVVTLPNNENLADWLGAANARVQLSAAAMQRAVELMNESGLETRVYRQQLLTATGEITTDVLDVGIVANLISEWARASADLVAQEGLKVTFRLLLVALILFVFIQLGKLVKNLLDRALNTGRLKISNLLRRMIVATG